MERLARNQSQYSTYEASAKHLSIPNTERRLPECEGDLGEKWYALGLVSINSQFRRQFLPSPGCALRIYVRLKYRHTPYIISIRTEFLTE